MTTPTFGQWTAAREAVDKARFDLERANRACYFADRVRSSAAGVS